MRYFIAVPTVETFSEELATDWYDFVEAAIQVVDPAAEVVRARDAAKDPEFMSHLGGFDRGVIDLTDGNHFSWLILGALGAAGAKIVTTQTRDSEEPTWAQVPVLAFDLDDLTSAERAETFGQNLARHFSAEGSDRPTRKVFVSYSHTDARFLKRLLVHLRPLEADGRVTSWSDTQLSAGDDWQDRIKAEIEQCDVAVLLVSADFLASTFIVNDELPPILTAAEGRGLRVMSVILKPCRFSRTPALSRFHAVNAPSEPLISASEARQEEIYDSLAEQIERTLV